MSPAELAERATMGLNGRLQGQLAALDERVAGLTAELGEARAAARAAEAGHAVGKRALQARGLN
jgi:hypothetical protein